MPELSLREHLSRAGKVRSPAKKKAVLANLEKANAALTAEQRKDRARAAVQARWAKAKKAVPVK